MSVGILLITHEGIGHALLAVATRLLRKLPLQTAAFEVPFDGDVDALLNRIELLLTSGGYRPETRTRIRDVVGAVVVPSVGETNIANARRDRVRLALFLTVASPEFLAQK